MLELALAASLLTFIASGSNLATKPTADFPTSGGSWVSFGPAPLKNCGQGTLPDQCSGRISAIAIDPTNANTIYVGSATGGVWKSTDGGSNWVPLMDNLTTGSIDIGALVIDSNGVLYAGTGDANWGFNGSGILKSLDGGKTWIRLGVSTFGRSAISKLAIDPTNPNKIFATASLGGTMATHTDYVYVEPGVQLGLFVSTDAGNSWTLIRPTQGTTFDEQAWDVAIDPANPSSVYLAQDGSLYVSHDGGKSWAGPPSGWPSPNSVGRISLGISVSSHLTLYAAIQYFDGSSDFGVGRLYRSNDGGSTWSMVNVPPPAKAADKDFCGKQCDYDLYVAVDPTDRNTIYLGGLDLYRSNNGGATWSDLGGYIDLGLIHVDQHAFAFSPTSHSKIYVGNDGGIFSSTNADSCAPTACWTDLNTNLGITQFYSIAVDPKDSSHLLGGTQDNGCLSHNGFSTVWTEDNNCGDGGWTGFDPQNPKIMYETQQWSVYKDGYDWLFRSEDGGATWVPIENGIASSDKATFMVPIAIDQSSPSTMYLGTSNLYKTSNRGGQWSKVSPGLSLPTPTDCSQGECISAITVAPSASNYIYVGTTAGNIFVSVDQGGHFTKDYGLPYVPVTQIAVDPRFPTQAYATFTGFGNGHVFSTSNAGQAWKDVSSNLPNEPVDSITLNQEGSGIYIGTDRGVYVSVNQGVSWANLGRGLPGVPVLDLKFASDGRLWAATHGRGAWVYSPKILVTLGNLPNNATVLIDGTTYTGAQLASTSFNWDPGSTHTLQVEQVEIGATGVRYIFVSWPDGSTDLTRVITATRPGDYSPVFKTQYLLTVVSDYDNPQGGGWYDEGSTATYSVSSQTLLPGILGILGARATFLRWNTGITSTTSTTIMNGPNTVQAVWATDYTLAYMTSSIITIVAILSALFAFRKRKRNPSRRQSRTCPNCGNKLPPDSTFCIECGKKVET